jgi:hypothetical protein
MNAVMRSEEYRSETEVLLIKSAVDAVDMAKLGRQSAQDLRSILVAIVGLSGNNSVIHGLAKVGQGLADDRIDMLDCECDAKQKILEAVRGAA